MLRAAGEGGGGRRCRDICLSFTLVKYVLEIKNIYLVSMPTVLNLGLDFLWIYCK
jgi:hypothetical protein